MVIQFGNVRSFMLPIIVINLIMFLLQISLGDWFTEMFLLRGDGEIFVRPWIMITSMFLHANPTHLLFNMYGVFLFGLLLEQRIGAHRTLAIYFASGIIAAFISSFFYDAALGASGALMGLIGALVIIWPNLRLLFLFAIPMPLWFAGVIYASLDIIGLFTPGPIANIAHLAGIGAGLAFGAYIRRKRLATPVYESW